MTGTSRSLLIFLQFLALLLVAAAATNDRIFSAVSNARLATPASLDLRKVPTWEHNVMLVRGGEIDVSSEEEDGIIVIKLRNMFRNLLQLGDKKVPAFSKVLRSCLKSLESATGIRWLPLPVKKGKKDKKPKAKAKKQKVEKKTEAKEEKEEEEESPKKEKTAKAKKPSAATKKHLTASIKANNPNYRIQKELKEFLKSPPPNLSVKVGTNLRVWMVTMEGAKNTIYEGETFKLRISFPAQYPIVPPSVYFLQGHVPLHEHVYTNGDICLSLLGKDWRPSMTAQSIAVSILSILSSAQAKNIPMDNSRHATSKPGEYQKDWVYHDDNC
jgi:ubiquitin-conjugating enzyme E2 W